MKLLVLSSSLDPASRSRILARRAFDSLEGEHDPVWLDTSTLELPLCDGGSAWKHEHATVLLKALEEAQGVLLALGVYNYAGSAAAKNLIELGGRGWTGKVVGFLCAAGGASSYMAVMSLANSLMRDFRSIIVPRFVYATADAFVEDQLVDQRIEERIEVLMREWLWMTNALSGGPPSE